MKIGLFVTVETEAHNDCSVFLDNIRQQVLTVRDAGFDSLWVPQHVFTGPDMQQFAASPMLGLLADMAEGMRLGTAVLLLPMLNPVLLAEEAATLDHLTGGRFVLGVALGYRDHEFADMGIERRTRVGRFREHVEVMRLLWAEEPVTYHGQHVTLANASLSLRPRNPTDMVSRCGSAAPSRLRSGARPSLGIRGKTRGPCRWTN